jgi:hypothetical protein
MLFGFACLQFTIFFGLHPRADKICLRPGKKLQKKQAAL